MRIKLITLITVLAIMSVSCRQQSGKIEFQTFHLEDFEKHPKGMKENDGFSYKINFVYPSEYSDKTVLDKLQKKFIRYTLGEEYIPQSVNKVELRKSVDAYIAELKKAYYNNVEELQNLNSDPNFVTGWHIECSNSILFMNETLLQLETKDGLYPSEAHVYENVSCHLFNLQTGDEYRRNEVFKSESAENIRKLIIPELLKQWNIQSLDEWGIERNRIWTPKTNFAITNEGMLIAQNDDELGSYSLTIPYAKILPYLREGTPVWDVASGGKTQGYAPQQAADGIQEETSVSTDKQNLPKPADILNVFKKVLTNEITHFDAEKQKYILLKDYFENNGVTATEIRFTLVDLDGEGIPEVIIDHFPGVERVLRFEDGTVYGFSFDFRSMKGLKKDGTFEWSKSAFNSGIGRQTFSGTNTDCINVSEESSEPDDDNRGYYIYYNKVTEHQYRAFMDAYYKIEDVEWTPFTTENVNNLKKWDELKYFYSGIPDRMFPIPIRSGAVIPYNSFSPPEEGWVVTSYKYEDAGFKESYKKQLREAGFVELEDTPQGMESLWRYDRSADGATLMVELINEENQLAIQMYVNYFN